MVAGGRGYTADGVSVEVDQAALNALLSSPAGPLGRMMVDLGQTGTQEAKRRAPVGERSSKTPGGHPSGHLRSQIGWDVTVDDGQIVTNFMSPAVTSPANPKPGEPYALYLERPELRPYGVPSWVRAAEGPYLEPAVMQSIREVLARHGLSG